MIHRCGHEDCKRSSYGGCLHETNQFDRVQIEYLIGLADRLKADLRRLKERNAYLEREQGETTYRQSWPEGSVKRENADLRKALKVKARQAEACESEIAELGKVRDQLHSQIEELKKRNQFLEHELIALGHVNCEWCLYWKQDEDSSDEGICELAGKSPWGMFRIDHREYGQAMAGHVLKTLCNFGCKEGRAK